MRRAARLAIQALVLLAAPPALTSCNGDDAGACEPELAGDAGATPLPAEIDAILERRCRACHSDPPRMFAPMPLVTWEHVHAPLPAPRDDEPVYEAIARRIHDERFPMPPVTEPPLENDERAQLDAWIEACASPAREISEAGDRPAY